MVDAATFRRLALALPEAEDQSTDQAWRFTVCGKDFAWSYLVRETPKGRRLPRLDVVALRCPVETKEMLIEAAPNRFFDDDHYRGYAALLVRLEAVGEDELRELLGRSWRAKAPKALARRHAPQGPD